MYAKLVKSLLVLHVWIFLGAEHSVLKSPVPENILDLYNGFLLYEYDLEMTVFIRLCVNKGNPIYFCSKENVGEIFTFSDRLDKTFIR
jgi:hypothetical protein